MMENWREVLEKFISEYRDRDYREKYHLKNMPPQEFIDLVLDVFDNKSYDSLRALYNYVIENFKITNFVLRTGL